MNVAKRERYEHPIEFYRQIIVLEHDVSRDEVFFDDLDHSQQRALHSIAHSRKFEYEYHQGRARVFQKAVSQSLCLSKLLFKLASAPTSRARSRMRQLSRRSSLSQSSPRPPTIHENGFYSDTADEYTSLPNSDFITTPDSAMPSRLTTQTPLTPSFPPPFMDFSGIQHQYEPFTAQPFQQQADTMSDLIMSRYPADETGAFFSSMYPDLPLDNEPFGSDASMASRRMSDNSFAMASASGLAAMPSYEDLSETLANSYDYAQPTHGSRGSSFTSLTTPLSPPNAPGYQAHKPTSRSRSVSSLHSERGRSRISKIFKRSSSANEYSPGMGEMILDSNEVRSSSRASSGRSIRKGPLDKLARAGMKAVRAIGGACWRCRILGKKVGFCNGSQNENVLNDYSVTTEIRVNHVQNATQDQHPGRLLGVGAVPCSEKWSR